MFTPRRILLLLAGLVGFVAAFAAYAYFLGGIDGLPQLPEKFVAPAAGDDFEFVDHGVSPTLRKLEIAFGGMNPSCPEARDSTTYQLRLEIPQPDGSRILLASGTLEYWKDQPRRVSVSPISVAIFGKPKSAADPGAVAIHTIHADRAIMEFDKPISSPQDIGRSRLLGLELLGDPELLSHDRRKGRVTITSNQGDDNPENWLVLRTPGPVYYSAPADPAKPPPPDVPQIRSSASVVLENRANIPKPLRAKGLPVPETRSGDFPGPEAVRDMILGTRTPPATVTADGFKLFLQAAETAPGKPATKGIQTGYSGLRKLELTEKVVVSLWTRPGSESSGRGKPSPLSDPSAAATALVGAAADGTTLTRRLETARLITIECPGAFTYDDPTNTARFRIAPHADSTLSNYVVVHRQSARGNADNLVCDVLDLELERGTLLAAEGPAERPSAKSAGGSNAGFKSVLATGQQVLVTSEAEQFMAQGTELRYATDAKTGIATTTLSGKPVTIVRERNRLVAGNPGQPSVLTWTDTPTGPAAGAPRRSAVNVKGPGRVDFTEPGAKEFTGYAEWAESLTFDKAPIGTKLYDRLILTRGSFKDTTGQFALTGDLVHLWLEPAAGHTANTAPLPTGAPAAIAKPILLQASGHVQGESDQLVIEKTDTLNVWFRDVAPVKPAVAAAGPAPAGPATPATAPGPKAAAAPPTKQPPVRLTARKIDAWMTRSNSAARPSASYALELANCVDNVEVHQAPADPKKNPRGLDVTAARLNLEGRANEAGTPVGYYVTIDGERDRLAVVQFEAVSLTGPKVVIDQPKNEVHVTGRGKLRMPTSSALTGSAVGAASAGILDVLWADAMRFSGADRVAKFTGKVQAEQTDRPTAANGHTEKKSWIVCHHLDVRFDRPVYFNQLKDPTKTAEGGPKITTAACYPQSDDELLRQGAAPGERVVFSEEEKRSGTIVSAQRLTALDLEFQSQERESIVKATGPGQVRILRPGAKEVTKAAQAPAGGSAAKPTDDSEMKLTLVSFQSRLRMNDQGKKFQKATFQGAVTVYHVASANLNLDLEPHALPARGLFLSCQDRMDVTTYQQDGKAAEQHMVATGNAEVRTDEYRGRGTTITYDGKGVELAGTPPRVAYMYRLNRDGIVVQNFSGERIIYDRSVADEGKRLRVIKWADGTFGK